MQVLKDVIHKDNAEVFKQILELNQNLYSVSIDYYPLIFYIVSQDALEILKFSLQVNQKLVNQLSSFRESLLHIAAEQQSFNCMQYLVSNHSSLLKLIDNDGESALMKLIQSIDFDSSFLDKLKLLQLELTVKRSKTAFQCFLERMVDEEIELSQAFTHQYFQFIILFFKPEWALGGVCKMLFDNGRIDLLNAVGELVKFSPEDFE
ncbi:Ankyrin_repeat-containing domain [Hexamita inflata]|uniref:Ankyrin repeat-containing domain n=1 Tax=Hexamita inflata TaxID=28002 RepID=A0AA86QZY5_9EUKA|nr:Ankyrin repeat-containing domain [Hexamita inflata]